MRSPVSPSVAHRLIVLFAMFLGPLVPLSAIPFRVFGDPDSIQLTLPGPLFVGSHSLPLGPWCANRLDASPLSSPDLPPSLGGPSLLPVGIPASVAHPCSPPCEPGIFRVVRMPLRAVCFSGARQWAPGLILPWRHCFKVTRIAAWPISAKVINLISSRYLSLDQPVHDPMSQISLTHEAHPPIAADLCSSDPVPAPCLVVDTDVDHKVFGGFVFERSHERKDMEIVIIGPSAGDGWDAVTGILN